MEQHEPGLPDLTAYLYYFFEPSTEYESPHASHKTNLLPMHRTGAWFIAPSHQRNPKCF
jgi:hypothetical protein